MAARLSDWIDLPNVPAGRYFLVLLVSKRIVHDSPNSMYNLENQQQWLKRWNDPSLDEPYCASVPAIVDVDEQGHYRPIVAAGTETQFEHVESEYHVNSKNELRVSTRFVNPADALMVVRGLEIYEQLDQSSHISVVREDGKPFERFPKIWGGSGPFFRKESHSVLVPRDGVIGGTEPYSGTLTPGNYQVTTEIDESIYKDKLFVDGKRVIRKPGEWPIVFRSRTTTITVPEKAP